VIQLFRLLTSGSRVARHKSYLLIEKDKVDQIIDYTDAITGHLKNVPGGDAEAAFTQDNAAMLVDEVMVEEKINREHL